MNGWPNASDLKQVSTTHGMQRSCVYFRVLADFLDQILLQYALFQILSLCHRQFKCDITESSHFLHDRCIQFL